MIYEERRTVLKGELLDDYLALCRETLWPSLRQAGGRVVCALSGLIGDPRSEVLQMTSFPDVGSWQAAQGKLTAERGELVELEEVRLMRPVASRPKEVIPREDRRAIYGYRRFFVAPVDLAEFVFCSEEGIWPRIEAQGACVLGLWSTVAATSPLEVVLITGYHDPAHWQETRDDRPMPQGFDERLWERNMDLRARRTAMTMRTWVRLKRAIEL